MQIEKTLKINKYKWDFKKNEQEALAVLQNFSCFDRGLATLVLAENAGILDKLIAYTAAIELEDGLMRLSDTIGSERNSTSDEEIKALTGIFTQYLSDNPENPNIIPLAVAYQALAAIVQDDAVGWFLDIYEDSEDDFVQDGIHRQLSGCIGKIDKNKELSLGRAKALFIHAAQTLKTTSYKNTEQLKKYVAILAKIASLDFGERFVAQAAMLTGIAYRKKLHNTLDSIRMHKRALELAVANGYGMIAAVSHFELGKMETDQSEKRKHFEESLRLRGDKDKEGQAMVHLELGKMEADQGKKRKHFEESLRLGG
ncbi:MAG TPA: hypothetical protein PLV58_11690, partial [Campylobacterales bacterium]|nr:hypothetical protein [Campylobacterales bacterium]